VGVQGRFDVAEHLVIYADGAGDGENRIPNRDHVAEEVCAISFVQGIEVWYYGVWQQEAVAR
jgi:hypothetical protein